MPSLDAPLETGSVGDFLLDLEVPVTLRFARKRILLGEVAALRSGSTMQLDRSAEDPVDLLVNNTLIARGHVVNVNGNCAVRIAELIPRDPRKSTKSREKTSGRRD